MLEIWVMVQVLAVGAFFAFSSYLTHRQRIKRIEKLNRTPKLLIEMNIET